MHLPYMLCSSTEDLPKSSMVEEDLVFLWADTLYRQMFVEMLGLQVAVLHTVY